MSIIPQTPQERAGLVTDVLNGGAVLSTREIANMCGISRQGAYRLMDGLSNVVPLLLYQGKWRRLSRQRHVDSDMLR